MSAFLISGLIIAAASGIFAARLLIDCHRRQRAKLLSMATLGRMSTGVAHDLGNTLMVIGARAEQLISDVSSTNIKQSATVIRDLSACASRLTRYMQTLAAAPDDEPRTNVIAHIKGLESLLSHLTGNAASLEFDTVDGIAYAEILPVQIDQILLNLILNALEAKATKISVTISLAEETQGLLRGQPDGLIVISVKDNGYGLSPRAQRLATKLFFTEGKDGGTGIGLATVQSIVQSAGGQFELSSPESSLGTTALIAIPTVSHEHSLKPRAPKQSALRHHAEGHAPQSRHDAVGHIKLFVDSA